MRRRVSSHASLYCNTRFRQRVASEGIRFIWPYSYTEIVSMDQQTSQCRFSDEFLMRVYNLRSYCLTKDFLDEYPELRGDAAQLEPSLTMCQVSDMNVWETLFWAQLRDTKKEKVEGEHDMQRSTELGK